MGAYRGHPIFPLLSKNLIVVITISYRLIGFCGNRVNQSLNSEQDATTIHNSNFDSIFAFKQILKIAENPSVGAEKKAIGTPIAEHPSHTTGRTGRVPGTQPVDGRDAHSSRPTPNDVRI